MTKSEAQTRSELIDQQLAQSGWNVKDPTQVVEEFDILTALPPGVAEPRTRLMRATCSVTTYYSAKTVNRWR